jgi:hypothetical protein
MSFLKSEATTWLFTTAFAFSCLVLEETAATVKIAIAVKMIFFMFFDLGGEKLIGSSDIFLSVTAI